MYTERGEDVLAVCEKTMSPRGGCVLSDMGYAESLVFPGVHGAQGHCGGIPSGKHTQFMG